MTGKTLRVVNFIDRYGLLPLIKPLHDVGRRSLLVLAYHRVAPLQSDGVEPLDLDLISATPDGFDTQMRHLRERMNPVPLTRLLDHLDGKRDLPRDAVAVTFDDGFQDTYLYALPILRKYSIPATVFVTTGSVESQDPFWFELAAYLMARLPAGTLRLNTVPEPLPYGSSTSERRRSLRSVHRELKALPHRERTQIIAEWRQTYAGTIDRSAADVGWPLTWAQMKEMAADGVEFGSHTVTHPNLAQLTASDLQWELATSREMLERELQREVITLAYPFGTRSTYDANVVHAAAHAGFRLAVSYEPGVNWANSSKPLELRRMGIDLSTDDARFRIRAALPAWFA